MDVPRSPYIDTRWVVHWDHRISILPRRCESTEQWIRPFTKAWRRTETHKYLALGHSIRWYSEEYIIFEKLKGNI